MTEFISKIDRVLLKLFLDNSRFRNCTEQERNIFCLTNQPGLWTTVSVHVFLADGKFQNTVEQEAFLRKVSLQITELFSVTSVSGQIYQPEVLESAFSVVSKLNCSLEIERSDTCIDLNEPEVDCMNWRIRSVKKRKENVNVLSLVSRLQFTGIENCK